MDKKEQFSIDILNHFINIVITDIADRYLMKLKKNGKNPDELISNYLDQAVFLSQKKVEISKVNKHISIMNDNIKNEVNNLIKQDKEYENLVRELNFVFNLIKNEELQDKVLYLLYNNFIKFKASYEPIKKIEEKINFNSVMNKFNKNKNINHNLNLSFYNKGNLDLKFY